MKNKIKVEYITNYLKENAMSKSEFCKRCKISNYSFNKIMSNEDNFSLITLFKISQFIKVEMIKFFNQ